MVSYTAIRALFVRKEKELTVIETEWREHLDSVYARLSLTPDRPIVKPSTTLVTQLAGLNEEVKILNLRYRPFARWGVVSDDGQPFEHDLTMLINECAVETVGPENRSWHFQRTLALVETYLAETTEQVEEAEERMLGFFRSFRFDFVSWFGLVDSALFDECCRMYEDAERDYLLDADEDKFADAVARVEEKWRDPNKVLHGIRDGKFVDLRANFAEDILEKASRFTIFGTDMSRQRVITEFFPPAQTD